MDGRTCPLVVVVEDLIFATKIRATAASLGIPVHQVRDASGLTAALEQRRPRGVVVDLSLAGDPIELVRIAAAHASAPTVIAFVAHVESELAAAAHAAGAHQVMPRSRFSTQLPAILQSVANREIEA